VKLLARGDGQLYKAKEVRFFLGVFVESTVF
jgi:hypothetical protein